MRSMWKGAISFGLVNIPIQLFAATSEKSVRFTLLHRACHTPIKYLKFCPHCRVELGQDDLVKGYPYDDDRYVIIEDEDLEQLPLPSVRTIEIQAFVNLPEIDPLYFAKSYYIEPQERADKAYGLLHRVLTETGRLALAKVALRQKESLAAVRAVEQLLVLHLMYYPDEVRSSASLRGASAAPEPTEIELRVAKQLVESLSTPFNPEAFEDKYRIALLQRIEQKAAGTTGITPPPGDGRIDDLLSALEASLREAQSKQDRAPLPVK